VVDYDPSGGGGVRPDAADYAQLVLIESVEFYLILYLFIFGMKTSNVEILILERITRYKWKPRSLISGDGFQKLMLVYLCCFGSLYLQTAARLPHQSIYSNDGRTMFNFYGNFYNVV
jgi:hypothetical protein